MRGKQKKKKRRQVNFVQIVAALFGEGAKLWLSLSMMHSYVYYYICMTCINDMYNQIYRYIGNYRNIAKINFENRII